MPDVLRALERVSLALHTCHYLVTLIRANVTIRPVTPSQ